MIESPISSDFQVLRSLAQALALQYLIACIAVRIMRPLIVAPKLLSTSCSAENRREVSLRTKASAKLPAKDCNGLTVAE